MWSTVRGVVPTLEQTGLDEGYLDLGEVAGDFLEARVVAEAVQTSVRGATSLTCSLGVAPCKVVAKVGSDARKPGGLVVVVPGQEAAFSRRSTCASSPVSARRRRSACARPGSGRSAASLRSATMTCGGCFPAASARSSATAHAASTRAASSMRPSASRSASRTRSSATSSNVSVLHRELRGMAREVAEHLQKTGRSARTVTTKLRYADFSIRSRSTSLDVGIDDAEQIGDLACRLLDRGLTDRPGALRLVGVGVSGLATYRQLALEAS